MLVVFSGNSGRAMYNFRLAVIKRTQALGYSVIAVFPEDDFTEKFIAENIEVINITGYIKNISAYTAKSSRTLFFNTLLNPIFMVAWLPKN